MTQEIRPLAPQEPGRPTPEAHDEPAPGLRILWGRMALLAVALVGAFAAGRITAPDPSAGALTETRQELDAARAEAADLRARLEAEVGADQAPAPEETTEAEEPAEPAVEGRVHVVEAGQTLRSIALKYYEDATLDDVIAEANGITDPEQLSVGTELVIPKRPEL
ncbi:MAG TPA: LysM peptidoglycan-binding domain-containing protein [Actinomycetota bacterium]|jgi:nucleoid-associated protein YgaU|nr:LysM peptidoglycan-binding domain-containing protein [Actinomycetota bacterium]